MDRWRENWLMNKTKQYKTICLSLMRLLEIDKEKNSKIADYINNYGIVNFFENMRLMELDEDTQKKLQAVKDILLYIENVDSRQGGGPYEN